MATHASSPGEKSLRGELRLAEGLTNLLGYDTSAKPLAPAGKSAAQQRIAAAGPLLADAQEKLFAGATKGDVRCVLLVLQGMDTSGKDGVVRHVVGLVGPASVKITSFKQPTPQEAAHHFLWRIRRALPGPGVIGVFNRSHYEDVVVTQVHERIDESTWSARIDEINAFEAQLADAGTAIVKCFLHIGYAEQRARLLSRLDDPSKTWKFNPADLDERAYWADYQSSYGSVLQRTSTEVAPWYVVPSDSKWYRNWAISQLLLETFEDLDLSFPAPDFDIEAARARLRPPY